MKIKNVNFFSVLLFFMSAMMVSCGSTSGTTSSSGNMGLEFKGIVSGNENKDHKIAFRQGQVLKVNLESDNKACYFNVLTETNEVIFNGSMDGSQFSGTVGFTGFYRMRVYLMGAANSNNTKVNYKLRYSLQ